MTDSIDSSFAAHLGRVRAEADAALAATGYDTLVIHSGRPALRFLDDSTQPFRVNPLFKQWVPLTTAPDCFLRHRPGERPLLCFCQPADYWHKPPALPAADWTREFELEVIRTPGAARELLGRPGQRTAFLGEPLAEFADWGFAAANPQPLLDRLHYGRAFKTPYELECMRRASRLAARGHVAARDAFVAGESEFEAHLAYCRAAGLAENELPYGNIVAFDASAAVLHYQELGRGRGPRRSFLIDAGAEYRGYAADVTRTYAAAPGDFAALVARMDALQLGLCAMVRAGTSYPDIHLEAHRRIAGLLREADIIDATPEAALESGLSSVFFPHGIGHLLGLQVHDVAGLAAGPAGGEIPRPPGHPYLRLTRRLEPGCVVTIEPGLYFIDLLLDAARGGPLARHIRWDAVDRLRPCGGIRIEDNVACTAGAPENLTRDAFAALSAAAC